MSAVQMVCSSAQSKQLENPSLNALGLPFLVIRGRCEFIEHALKQPLRPPPSAFWIEMAAAHATRGSSIAFCRNKLNSCTVYFRRGKGSIPGLIGSFGCCRLDR